MKLFVINNLGQKVYLDTIADNREELAIKIGAYNFTIKESNYNINDVNAETNSSEFIETATVGAGVGMFLGGPIGALVGGVIAGVFGNKTANNDKEKVQRFNNSKLTPYNNGS